MFKHYFSLIFFICLNNDVVAIEVSKFSGAFEVCREKAMALKPGQIIKLELKQQDDEKIYEFDIRDERNQDWDLACAVAGSEIIEVEEEVFGVNDPRFREQMKVDYKRAKNIALDKYPGEIIEVEYEIEQSGLAVYEFDIMQTSGQEIKLEINARNGQIHEVAIEIWQVGYE